MNRPSSTYRPTASSDTHSAVIVCFDFAGKENDLETGLSYFGARYYDADLTTGWLSVDPMADKYPSMSPYNYCAGNPVKLVDPDGRDVYRLDTKTGSLVLHKKDNAKIDRIEAGTYLNNGGSKVKWKRTNQIGVSKGILNGKIGEDLSKTGFVTTSGNQRDGLRLARFISFESYKELGGVGFKNRGMDELEVFRWDKNTSSKANVYISDKDDITFSFHTHPGDRQGKGGHSGLDKKDRDCACLARQMYGAYQNYIITRHDGIQYYNEWNIIPETIYVLPKTFIGIY